MYYRNCGLPSIKEYWYDESSSKTSVRVTESAGERATAEGGLVQSEFVTARFKTMCHLANSLFVGKSSHTGRDILFTEHNLTQEALGEKLGVTNKTVSRWENANYMPDIEMLQLLSKELNVSVNELLAGEFLSDEEFRKKADENVIAVSKASAFSLEERKAYFKKKWRKEHTALFVLLGLLLIAAAVLPFVFDRSWLVGLVPLLALVEYGYQNNQMMAYVEHCLYD